MVVYIGKHNLAQPKGNRKPYYRNQAEPIYSVYIGKVDQDLINICRELGVRIRGDNPEE